MGNYTGNSNGNSGRRHKIAYPQGHSDAVRYEPDVFSAMSCGKNVTRVDQDTAAKMPTVEL
jgi:hypothetical protein